MINKKLVETPVKMMNRMEEITDLICEYNDEVQKQQEENTRLQQRIDKAIEYIKDKYAVILADDLFLDHDERIERKRLLEIKDILKGSDKK